MLKKKVEKIRKKSEKARKRKKQKNNQNNFDPLKWTKMDIIHTQKYTHTTYLCTLCHVTQQARIAKNVKKPQALQQINNKNG